MLYTVLRSKDPLLMVLVIIKPPIAPDAGEAGSGVPQAVLKSAAVFGARSSDSALIGMLAPWLGTIDSTAINPIGDATRCRR